jgi:chromosomal replication initiator protein
MPNEIEIWTAAREALADELPRDALKIWIEPLRPLRIEGRALVLGCPNTFFMSWIREHYLDRIREVLGGLTPPMALGVRLEVAGVDCGTSPAAPAPVPKQQELPAIEARTRGPLKFNRRFVFDRFVVGQANRFAYAATVALASAQDFHSSCLFLIADTGLGKSHLSQALGHQILADEPRKRVRCLTAEDFTNELVYSIKNRTVEEFKDKFRRHCDVLVLEEIHFLSGKEKIQAELCYTFDCLAENGARIVFTASSLPRDIPKLTRALASRLAGGLISTIEPPDFETRLRILEQRAEEYGLAVADAVLEFMATRVKSDVRKLESCLYSLGAKSKLMGRDIDLALAEEALQDLGDDDEPADMETVRNTVCRFYKVTPDDLRSRGRGRKLTLPRNVAMYLGRQMTDLSFEEIGQAFGRNHSTALYSVNQVEARLRRDPALKGQIDFLTDQLKGNRHAC